MVKLIDADFARQAQERAADVAGDRGYPAPRRVIDTDFAAHAWTVLLVDGLTEGILVYEDDPGVLASVENRPGRFIEAGAA